MEKKINSKTTKAQLIEMMTDDQLKIKDLEGRIESLNAEVKKLKDQVELSKDTTHSLRVYLTYVKKTAKDLWKTMEEKFSGMPGFVQACVKPVKKEKKDGAKK